MPRPSRGGRRDLVAHLRLGGGGRGGGLGVGQAAGDDLVGALAVDRLAVAGGERRGGDDRGDLGLGVSGAIRESGGIRRVAASGVGTPLGESTVTNASPMPRLVIVRSTS